MISHAILYDCDGTLIDSETITGQVCAAALTAVGHPMTAAEFNARFTGVPAADTWTILRREITVPLPADFNAAIDREIHRRFDEELLAIEGAREAVIAIGGRRGVASSTRLDPLRKNLATTGLIDLFDPHVYSASQVARGKPAPDVFLFAASQLGADPGETFVIEDSVAGVTAARRAGMAVIGFTGAGHGAADLAGRLFAAGAAQVVPHMRDLPGVIEHMRRN